MQQGPQREPFTKVFGETKIDFHVLDTRLESFRRHSAQI